MNDLVRVEHCLKMFKQCQGLEGHVAECGVAFGQTTFPLDKLVKSANKLLFAFDTFKGLPYWIAPTQSRIVYPDLLP